MMWWRSIRARIHSYLPAGSVLEIAPGFGRWTEFLLGESARLEAVDVTPACVEACRERFSGVAHAAFHVNDGESLPMVADGSVDFAFSLDSLVHVEAPQLTGYLRELRRTLKPGGAAFLHHSNLGAYVDRSTGRVVPWVGERHWRAESVSAAVVREGCRHAGLVPLSQELINWIGRDSEVDHLRLPGRHIPLTDCLTLLVRPAGRERPLTRVYVNHRFVEEWRELIELTRLSVRENDSTDRDAQGAAAPRTRANRSGRAWRSGLRSRLAGYVAAWRDPAGRALRDGRCPDCGRPGAADARGIVCPACGVEFRLA